MRLSIKSKQVLGVTTIVGLATIAVSLASLERLGRVTLDTAYAQAQLFSDAIFQRAQTVVRAGRDPVVALGSDEGLRSLLESSLIARQLAYVAIVDVSGVAIAHSDNSLVGLQVMNRDDAGALLALRPMELMRAVYSPGGKMLEIRRPLLLGGKAFGSIRIGMSTLLIREDFERNLYQAYLIALIALAGAPLVSLLLAQLLLRPIHVLRSGLSRLGRGEFGVTVDLPRDDEFGELGQFFNAVSARLSQDSSPPAPKTAIANVDHVLAADGVAVFDTEGALLFANDAFRASLLVDFTLGLRVEDLWPASHPFRLVLDDARVSQQPRGPAAISMPPPDWGERTVFAEPLVGSDGRNAGMVLIVRNLDYFTQISSTLSSARKLAALSRLSAGIAHEMKNPLTGMARHLELLRQRLVLEIPTRAPAETGLQRVSAAGHTGPSDALEYARLIGQEIDRLETVMQGFLKFTRPEDLKLQAARVASLVDSIHPNLAAQAEHSGVELSVDIPEDLPDIRVDRGLMEQVLLNLVINACQAMPNGGRLRLAGATVGRRVAILCEDTGIGIAPEDLDKIFDLYFTTKGRGSGIGLSMVYRIVQQHDGEIEVQSTRGRGTTFRVLLPQA